jgi:NDP-sugar pyrophosphorylase family protein
MLGKLHSKHQECAYLVNPELISIGEGTIVEPGAYIRGPCIIGRNCHIRHAAYIRGNVLVGDRCVVGHATELKSCILLNHARAAHFAFVGDSILGNDVNLGAGVKCANLRLDETPVTVRFHNESISTGLRKLGSIIGDGCQIGCNTVLNPGTLLGKHAKCYPCINVSGVVEEGCVAKKFKE